MSMMKNYLLSLTSLGANTEQADAIEWAIHSNWLPIEYEYHVDRAVILLALPELVKAKAEAQ
jgi:hypothetical protein